ncbi:MAG: ABC transporter ATP-binding protein [Desulfuromonadaceae bacterium]
MSTVITVENLGKKYTLHHQQREQYTALRDVISNGVRNLSKKILSPFTTHTSPVPTDEDFWALKDVSFEVNQGDRIGIIGRNGAGKSTLLKILSRITEPTTGSVRIKGRVASLLEVGTGFHPELTGRENIFLNGAILGMGRAEIKKKFDEIVDFAEIEKFLDTPVKRYSSGMYVRLAFAVAAHLEPEILIVDEVLAVGDAQFQKKCLGKMEDVGKEGRTVLFVSHNMGAINRLCQTCLYLSNGQILNIGPSSKISEQYLLEGFLGQGAEVVFNGGEHDDIQFISSRIERTDGSLTTFFRSDEDVRVLVTYKVKRNLAGVSIAINITTGDRISLWSMGDWEEHPRLMVQRQPGIWTGEWIIPSNVLRPGRYFIACGAGSPQCYFHHPEPFPFEISLDGTWRPAYLQLGVSGGPISLKMGVKPPVLQSIIKKTTETI